MTEARRREIFSQEAISTKDLQELLGVCKSSASTIMGDIKAVVGDRLNVKGKILVEDYLKWVDTQHPERYSFTAESLPPIRRTVNVGGGRF